MAKIARILILFILSSITIVHAANMDKIRLWHSPDGTRIVIDLDKEAKYKSFDLFNPHRLVLDIENSRLKNNKILQQIKWDNTDIVQVRYSANKNNLRLVFDLKNKIKYKIFNLSENKAMDGYRIVLDIEKKTDTKINVKELPKLTNLVPTVAKKFTIVIDPGHGGEDPGAIGPMGTQEKDVVLEIAKYLKQYIDQDSDMQAILTRDKDYYLELRTRTEKARAKQSDLFISIHADGFRDRRATGASVFVLSERGASSELAKWIADTQNASDLVGGVSLDNKDTMLATVLLDLSQTASNRAGYQLANNVLREIATISDLHKSQVQKAGFVVLKSPDIPSILVETGFISNPNGERNLRTKSYQRKMAYSIYKGVKAYLKTQPRPTFTNEVMQTKND
jgi:N-acetylmuramoyl-L-alanine amidase